MKRFVFLLLTAWALAAVACERAGAPLDATLSGCSARSTAARLLAEAARARSAFRASAAEDRETARDRAVEAYRAVYLRAPNECEAAAEAAFRAAELLRAGGRFDEARHEFERSIELADESELAARATLEFGHVERRAGRLDAALAAYERAAADPRAAAAVRDTATWWCARSQAERGRSDEARRIWERLARGADDPLLRVRAFDAWMGSLVEARSLEEAAGVLELCRASLRATSGEATELGQRVSAALEAMRAPAALAEAIAERAAQERECAASRATAPQVPARMLTPPPDAFVRRRMLRAPPPPSTP